MKKWMASIASALFLTAPVTHAADFPNKPVSLIVPYSAGGGSDGISRALATKLSEIWGQSVVVENIPGADGLIGARRVMRSPADGHTILISIQAILFLKHLSESGVDPMESLTPVSLLAEGPTTLAVSSKSGISSVADLQARCVDAAANCSWASGEPFTLMAGNNLLGKLGLTEMTNVRYGGTAPAVNDVVGGHVTLVVTGVAPILPQHVGGNARILAIGSPERLPELADVPTYTEVGLGDVDFTTTWYGIFSPAGTPEEIKQEISKALQLAVKDESVIRALGTLKINPVGSTPEEFAQRIERDEVTLKKLIEKTPLK